MKCYAKWQEIHNKGRNNPAWLDGLSKAPYSLEFSERLKEKIRERDNYKCQLCDAPAQEFERKFAVHHIDYNKKNNDSVNLITLCIYCNTRVNMNREYWRSYFQELMIKKEIHKLHSL